VIIVEVTDRVVRYALEGYPNTIFFTSLGRWTQQFEPFPLDDLGVS
jgi:hypothetical protein